jgi:hypothetical protein
MKKNWLFLFILLIFFVDFSFGQCAMCKANLESGTAEEVSFGKNINIGIMMLMITPYIILFLLFRKKLKSIYKALFK